MCLSDWRAGRYIKSVSRSVFVPNISSFTIAASPQRVGITVCPSTADAAAGAFVELIVAGAIVDCVSLFPHSMKFNLKDDGDTPTKSFVINNPSNIDCDVGVTEYFMTEEFLAKGAAEWLREMGA
jgi:hypothetical protein